MLQGLHDLGQAYLGFLNPWTLAYGLGGVGRASLLVVFAMHIMFAMLTWSPRQKRNMGVATLTSILCTSFTMRWRAGAARRFCC